MLSQAADYPRAAAALSGIGLTVQVASAVTDDLPIVKQVLGVVSSIVKLAQDIEKNREALRAVVDKARNLGTSLEIVSSGSTVKLDSEFVNNLKRIHTVLREIEALCTKYSAKKRLGKALSYAFTVSSEIDRLSKDLSAAIEQFNTVTSLASYQSQKENERYRGGFHVIHGCDVDRDELITEELCRDKPYAVEYYTAAVGGQVRAVRYLARKQEGSSQREAKSSAYIETAMAVHERILRQMSTVQYHRRIARFYGEGEDGSGRFVVLKSGGYRPVRWLYKHCPGGWSVPRASEMVCEILDAACYLEEHGAAWCPGNTFDTIFVDDHGVPTIGLKHDLCDLSDERLLVPSHCRQIMALGALFTETSPSRYTGWTPSRLANDGFPDDRFDRWFAAARDTLTTLHQVVPRAHLASSNTGRPLSAENAAYIRKAMAHFDGAQADSWLSLQTGIVYLRAAVSAAEHALGGPSFVAEYFVRMGPGEAPDFMTLSRYEEANENIEFIRTVAHVPASIASKVRAKLKVVVQEPIPEGENVIAFHLIRTPNHSSGDGFVETFPRR